MLSSDSFQLSEDVYAVNGQVVWTLFMMDRLFNTSSHTSPSVNPSFFRLCLFDGPQNPATQPDTSRIFTLHELIDHKVHPESVTIASLNIELLSIWEDVVTEIFHSSKAMTVPFWKDGSSRSKIISRLLEAELSEHRR